MNLQYTLSGEEWMSILEEIAIALPAEGTPIRLCLIGSAVCLFSGMEGRSSRNLDIWRPASDYDRLELQSAANAAGILFDPKSTLEPKQPYLQIVDPGLTQLGSFEPVLIDRLGRLHLYRPPIENLIAAKLIRADQKDLADIRFLLHTHRPDHEAITAIVHAFPSAARECAVEILVYLAIL